MLEPVARKAGTAGSEGIRRGNAPGLPDEIDFSALTRQCLDRRIDDLKVLNTELAAWQAEVNADQRQVQWHFTTSDARTRLRHLYPKR